MTGRRKKGKKKKRRKKSFSCSEKHPGPLTGLM
jgi:hypothetical protein